MLPGCSTCSVTKMFTKKTILTWNSQTGNTETVRCSFKPILSTYGPSKTNANLFYHFYAFWEKKCMNWLQFLLLLFSVKSQKGKRPKKLIIFFQEAAFQHGGANYKKRGNYYHFLEKRSHLPLSFSKLFYTKEFISVSSQNKPLLALF